MSVTTKLPPLKKKRINILHASMIAKKPHIIQERLNLNLNLLAYLDTIEEGVILHFIIYWALKNESKKRYDYFRIGFYWTYSSVRELNQKYFNSITEYKIDSAIKRLISNKLIVAAQLSHSNCNRSKWYRPDYEALNEIGFSKSKLNEFFYIKSS